MPEMVIKKLWMSRCGAAAVISYFNLRYISFPKYFLNILPNNVVGDDE